MDWLTKIVSTLLLAATTLCTGRSIAAPPPPPPHTHMLLNHVHSANATLKGSTLRAVESSSTSGATGKSQLSLVNNLCQNARAYITCKNSAGNWAYVSPDDKQLHELNSAGVIAQEAMAFDLGSMGQKISFALGEYVSECRVYGSPNDMQLSAVWSADGKYSFVQPAVANPGDPNYAKNFGVLEFSLRESPGKSCANPSQVDFIDVGMGFEMIPLNGSPLPVVGGLVPDAKVKVCEQLQRASTAQAPWGKGCIYDGNALIRVLAPDQVIGGDPGAFRGYFDEHNHRILQKYATVPLTVQLGDDHRTCHTNAAEKTLDCEGFPAPIHFEPTARDIFTCTGPFTQGDAAVMHRICAAYNRGTLLQAGGELQPSVGRAAYYTNDAHNVYSSAVHRAQQDGIGYAFPRDDVEASGHDSVSGLICAEGDDVRELRVLVGGRG